MSQCEHCISDTWPYSNTVKAFLNQMTCLGGLREEDLE